MERYKNLYLLGTSHIAIQSIKEVSATIKQLKPEIVALELDPRRLKALFDKEHKLKISDIKYLGAKAFLINYIAAGIEKKLGKPVAKEEVFAAAEDEGISQQDIKEILISLKSGGETYEPKPGFVQRV